MNNCYIYITGLDPIGTIYSTTVCNEMRKIKEQRFYIYYRSQTNIFDEFKVFNKFIQRLNINYDKFYIIGHSYGLRPLRTSSETVLFLLNISRIN